MTTQKGMGGGADAAPAGPKTPTEAPARAALARTLSNWEYSALLAEAQALIGRRLDKIYEIEDGLFRLDFGPASLIVRPGAFFYLTQKPPAAPPAPSAFAMVLRKHLEGHRLASFSAHRSDRIYTLRFHSGLSIVLEQYSAGNLFLLDEKGNLIRPYHFKAGPSKAHKVGEPYTYADSPLFPLPPGDAQWAALRAGGEQKLESSLGRWPVGKLYTAWAIRAAGLDPKAKVGTLGPGAWAALRAKVSSLFTAAEGSQPARGDGRPTLYLDGQGAALEVSLLDLPGLEEARGGAGGGETRGGPGTMGGGAGKPEGAALKEHFESWSAALERFYSLRQSQRAPPPDPDLIRLHKRRAEQGAALARAEADIAELERKARWLEAHLGEMEAHMHALGPMPDPAQMRAGERFDAKSRTLVVRVEEKEE